MAKITQAPSVHLVLGGARSGKSGYAESLATQSHQAVVYVATAQALDGEMNERIAQHQQDRPSHWLTIEEPLKIAQVITEKSREETVILVDCLTLWLMSVMHYELDLTLAVDELLHALQQAKGLVILVSNEITMGVVPMGELSRNYVDNLGRLHQQVAQQAQQVTLMVAGIPMSVKPNAAS